MGLDSSPSRDIEYQELERHDLLTGEPRYIEDEIRNANFATYFGAIAALLSLVAMILSWVLYYRDRSSTYLWHSIWLIFAFLFGLACAGWGATAVPAIRTGNQPNPMFTLVVFLGSLLFLGYLLLSAIWLTFFRPIHYDFLVGLRTDNDLWNKRMTNGSSFNDGWTSSRRMMWWVILFTLIAGICFAFTAYASRSVVWNRYNLTRFALYFALVWIVFISWMIIYWAQEAFLYEHFSLAPNARTEIRVLKVLAILALIYAAVNALVNLLKVKIGYFLLAMIGIVFLVVLVGTTGLIWREIRLSGARDRSTSNGGSVQCTGTQSSIHENSLQKWCPTGGKYLAEGQTCTKDFLASRWEGNNEGRFLNPACCLTAKYVYIWPYMLIAYWATALIIAVAIAIGCNFYLGDTSEYLTNANKSIGLPDILALVAIFLLFAGFGLYFILRKARSIPNGTTGLRANSFIVGGNPADPNVSNRNVSTSLDGFTTIPAKVLNASNPATQFSGSSSGQVCAPYDTTTLPVPVFNKDDTVCKDVATCSIRLSLFVKGAKFNATNLGGSVRALGDARYNFFSNCDQTDADYITVSGTEAQIGTFLKSLTFCLSRVNSQPDILARWDQQKSADIGVNGLLGTETLSPPENNKATTQCGTGFGVDKAKSPYKGDKLISNVDVAQTVVGRLHYIEGGAIKTDLTPINDISKITGVLTDDNGAITDVNFYVFKDGTAAIQSLPVYKDTSYKVRLTISDAKGIFLPKTVEVLVDPKSKPLSFGDVRLVTKDATVCATGDAACLAKQTLLKGKIQTIAFDSTSNAANTMKPLSGVSFTPYTGFVAGGTPAQSAVTSDSNGAATIDTNYGAYTVIGTKTGYVPVIRFIDLQEPTNSPAPFYLRSESAPFDYLVKAEYAKTDVDWDLIVQAKSISGATCETSPYNKYCAFGAHANDVQGIVGEEQVVFNRLSIATYNAFVQQSPSYNKECTAASTINANAYHFEQGIQWSHLNQTTKVDLSQFKFTTATGNDNAAGSNLLLAILKNFPRHSPVETPAQSKIAKILAFFQRGNPHTFIENLPNTDFSKLDETATARLKGTTPLSGKFVPRVNTLQEDITIQKYEDNTTELDKTTKQRKIVAEYTLTSAQNTIKVASTNTTKLSTVGTNSSGATEFTSTISGNETNGTATGKVEDYINFSNENKTLVNATGFIRSDNETLNVPGGVRATNDSRSEIVNNVEGTFLLKKAHSRSRTLKATVAGFEVDSTESTNVTETNSTTVGNSDVRKVNNKTCSAGNCTTLIVEKIEIASLALNHSKNYQETSTKKKDDKLNQEIKEVKEFEKKENGLSVELKSNNTKFNSYENATQETSFEGSTASEGSGSSGYVVKESKFKEKYVVPFSNNTSSVIITEIDTTSSEKTFANKTDKTSPVSEKNQTKKENLVANKFTGSNKTTSTFTNIVKNNNKTVKGDADLTQITINTADVDAANTKNVTVQETSELKTWDKSEALRPSQNYQTLKNAKKTVTEVYGDKATERTASNFLKCENTTVTDEADYTAFNSTTTVDITLTAECTYVNNSKYSYKNVSYVQKDAAGAVKLFNWVETVKVGDNAAVEKKDGTPAPKRLLMESSRRRRLQGSSTDGNIVWVRCWTGFGAISDVSINTIVKDKPTVADCEKRIETDRPNYTVQKLQTAVDAANKA